MKGAPLAERIRDAGRPRRSRELGSRRPRHRARRRRPGLAHLRHDASTRRAAQAGIRSDRPPPPGRDAAGGAARASLDELNADDAVDGILVQLPLPGADRRGARDPRGRPDEGRRRLPPVQRGPALPRAGRPSSRRRRSGSWRCSREHRSRARRARGRSSSGAARSSASPSRTCCCGANATVTDLPLAHRATSRRETRDADVLVVAVGQPGAGHAGHGQGGRGRRGRRHQPHRGGARRRRRPGRRRARGVPHAGARRRRPDDDRDAAPQHGAGRPLPPQSACVPLDGRYTFAPRFRQGPAARCPGRRLCSRREQLAQGTVKWFSNEKGYGFIEREEGEDVFVHFSAITMDGLQVADRGPARRVRGRPGRQGPAGGERPVAA